MFNLPIYLTEIHLPIAILYNHITIISYARTRTYPEGRGGSYIIIKTETPALVPTQRVEGGLTLSYF